MGDVQSDNYEWRRAGAQTRQLEDATNQTRTTMSADDCVLVPVKSLRWWRVLAEINPKDLVPRIDAVLNSIGREKNNEQE